MPPTQQAPRRFHYAWVICLACTLSASCSLGIATTVFSVYMSPIMDAYGFSKAETSLIPTVATLACTLFILIGTRLYHKTGIRFGVMLGLLSFALSNVLFAFSTHLAGFYIGAVFSGIPTAISGILPISMIITNWFSRRKGLALGLSMSGSGIGTIVAPPIIAGSIEANGLRLTLLLEAALVFVLAVAVFLLLRAKPEDMGLTKYGQEDAGQNGAAAHRPEEDCRPRLSGRWGAPLVMASMLLFGYIGVAVTSHISVHYVALGYQNTFAAVMVSIFGVSVICGKLLLGVLSDRLGCYAANYIHFGLLFLAMLLFCFVNRSIAAAYLSPLLLGLGHPILSIGSSLWLPELFPPHRYASYLSLAMFLIYLGGSVGTAITGVVASWSGNYILSFLLMLACALAGAAIIQGAFICLRAKARGGRPGQ